MLLKRLKSDLISSFFQKHETMFLYSFLFKNMSDTLEKKVLSKIEILFENNICLTYGLGFIMYNLVDAVNAKRTLSSYSHSLINMFFISKWFISIILLSV
jgi:hypothetical protein